MSEQDSHASFVKTPQQLFVAVLLASSVLIIVIVALVELVVTRPQADPAAMTPDAVAARIQPVGRIEFGAASAGGARAQRSGEDVVKSVCAVCHQTGAAGAPKIGDKAAWAKLNSQGLDRLTQNAAAGIRAMPPRGGNPDVTDFELARAIVYMGNRSGGKLKEPAEPAPAAAK